MRSRIPIQGQLKNECKYLSLGQHFQVFENKQKTTSLKNKTFNKYIEY